MELLSITPFTGQPTLTHPLSRERTLEGRETQALEESETQNTVISNEQRSMTVNNAVVVTQVEELSATGFDSATIGGSIDITA